MLSAIPVTAQCSTMLTLCLMVDPSPRRFMQCGLTSQPKRDPFSLYIRVPAGICLDIGIYYQQTFHHRLCHFPFQLDWRVFPLHFWYPGSQCLHAVDLMLRFCHHAEHIRVQCRRPGTHTSCNVSPEFPKSSPKYFLSIKPQHSNARVIRCIFNIECVHELPQSFLRGIGLAKDAD